MAQELHPLQLESKRVGRALHPLGHLGAADVKGPAAAIADQVLVGLAAGHHRLVGVGVAELDLARQPKVHQEVEGAVDGGPLEAGELAPDAVAELVRGGVTRVLEERRVDQPTLGSEPLALLPKGLQTIHDVVNIPVACYCNTPGAGGEPAA